MAGSDDLQEFADLMVDELICRVRSQLEAGEGLSLHDQRCLLEQLIADRKRRFKARPTQEPMP